MVEQIMIEL